MRTLNTIAIRAPLARVFEAASSVERWPDMLPHYRWVRVLERHDDWDLVDMAAWRPFGFVKYPTWWVCEMRIDRTRHEVRYRHVRGITRGMEVVWSLEERDGVVRVSIVHEWGGPRWPVIGTFAANAVIGPVFIHGIAARTLAGIRRSLEGTLNA